MYVWEMGCNHTHLHDQIQAAVTLVKGVRKMSPNSIKNFADLQITIFMVLPHMVLCTYITCHHVLLLAMNRGNKCQLLHLSYTYQKVKYFSPISYIFKLQRLIENEEWIYFLASTIASLIIRCILIYCYFWLQTLMNVHVRS